MSENAGRCRPARGAADQRQGANRLAVRCQQIQCLQRSVPIRLRAERRRRVVHLDDDRLQAEWIGRHLRLQGRIDLLLVAGLSGHDCGA